MAETGGENGALGSISSGVATENVKGNATGRDDGVMASIRQSISAIVSRGNALSTDASVAGAPKGCENSTNVRTESKAKLPDDSGCGSGVCGGGGERFGGGEGASGDAVLDIDGSVGGGSGGGGRGGASVGGDGGDDGGEGGGDNCCTGSGGGGEGGREGGDDDGGGDGANNGGADTSSSATAAAAAAAEEDIDAAAGQTGDCSPSPAKKAEEHLSCKYTKEELLARHWGMDLNQMKRVKALLRMGVCEEDLEIADRLLKMGR